mmetsp:Transcript_5429/g.13566  ORF Transcript_5429/g.13566 Transcript_5429/m.13566 type:complete len:271 (+) Transcript_5429:1692-2504(+)
MASVTCRRSSAKFSESFAMCERANSIRFLSASSRAVSDVRRFSLRAFMSAIASSPSRCSACILANAASASFWRSLVKLSSSRASPEVSRDAMAASSRRRVMPSFKSWIATSSAPASSKHSLSTSRFCSASVAASFSRSAAISLAARKFAARLPSFCSRTCFWAAVLEAVWCKIHCRTPSALNAALRSGPAGFGGDAGSGTGAGGGGGGGGIVALVACWVSRGGGWKAPSRGRAESASPSRVMWVRLPGDEADASSQTLGGGGGGCEDAGL